MAALQRKIARIKEREAERDAAASSSSHGA
jgi:hypothetical protein